MLLVIPAIDIKGGKCVRLVQGLPDTETIDSDDPVKMAILWRGENAKTLHVVDLDGALEGKMKNLDVIKKIVQTVDIPIQLSGGIRTDEQVKEFLNCGIYRIVIGAIAVENPDFIKRLIDEFGPRKIVVGIEAKNGLVQIPQYARKKDSGLTAISLVLMMKQIGVERIVYTDITRVGTMTGPNFKAIKELAENARLKITASGGISGYPDLKKMEELEPLGVDSVIIGRALYENKFPCQQLWRICEKDLMDLGPTRRT